MKFSAFYTSPSIIKTNIPSNIVFVLLLAMTLKELNITKPEIDKLTLSQLLQSMSGKNKGSLKTPKPLRATVSKTEKQDVEEGELTPQVLVRKVKKSHTL